MQEGNAPTESDFWPNNLVGFSRHLANHPGSHLGGDHGFIPRRESRRFGKRDDAQDLPFLW